MEHYLDNSATTRVCKEAVEACIDAMTENYGNPSSTHKKGRDAKALLESCRADIASVLGANAKELIFTSCGSESDNMAIISGAMSKKRQGKHIISSAVEHDAVRKSLDYLEKNGFEVTRLKPDKTGAVSVQSVMDAVRDDTVLVTLMLVNNETGAVTDISGISKAIKNAGYKPLIHTDAVQAFKKIPFTAKSLGADMISISAHKIHAVKGTGALYIKQGIKLEPIIMGGMQEGGLRAGTEALPQIAAFAAAAKLEPQTEYIASLKQSLTDKLTANIPELRYIDVKSPHILNISMPGWRSEVLMNFLEQKEVYVSKSSACKQGKRSHVLEAIGLGNDVIDGALRIGLCRYNTEEDIDALVNGLVLARQLAHR